MLPTLHSQYASTCFLVEHPSEIDVRAVACSLSSSDLKYKLMRHVTFNPLLFWIASGLISCIFI